MANSNSNSINVVEVCRVAPPLGSPDSITSDHSFLTLFDLLWFRFPPVETLYFYELPPNSDPKTFYHSILPEFKASLSITLQHFSPLAGTLAWPENSPKPVLTFVEGDSVSFTTSESNADDFPYLSGNGFVEAKDYHPLIPPLEVSGDRAAILAVQITLFPSRGFSIGTSMHHSALDGRNAFSFFKAWAYIHKSSSSTSIPLPNHLKPFHDRNAIHDPNDLAKLYSNDYLNKGGPNNRSVTDGRHAPKVLPEGLVRGTFTFTRDNIKTLRESLANSTRVSDPSSSLHLSTFSLGCAYTWICLVKAAELKGDENSKTAMIFGVDVRSRLDPPVPETYFGNCIAGRVAMAETKGLIGGDGLIVAVEAITKALRSLEDGILNGAELWVSKFLDFSLYDKIYSIAGSQRFEVYDTDFGFGRPKKIELVSIDDSDAVSLMDSKSGGGAIEVGIALKKPQMEVFASLFAKSL